MTPPPSGGASPGPDGRLRCPWATGARVPADYVAYHDEEWGRPVHGDSQVLERIVLEGFQSGLSWLTILRKRPAFRECFAGFDPYEVAAFGDAEVDRLLADARIVRHRGKIVAAITNARATACLLDEHGTGALDRLFWSFVPADRADDAGAPQTLADVPGATTESAALATTLKRHGFVFVGPTTAYAAMQACGVVNDHLEACVARR